MLWKTVHSVTRQRIAGYKEPPLGDGPINLVGDVTADADRDTVRSPVLRSEEVHIGSPPLRKEAGEVSQRSREARSADGRSAAR